MRTSFALGLVAFSLVAVLTSPTFAADEDTAPVATWSVYRGANGLAFTKEGSVVVLHDGRVHRIARDGTKLGSRVIAADPDGLAKGHLVTLADDGKTIARCARFTADFKKLLVRVHVEDAATGAELWSLDLEDTVSVGVLSIHDGRLVTQASMHYPVKDPRGDPDYFGSMLLRVFQVSDGTRLTSLEAERQHDFLARGDAIARVGTRTVSVTNTEGESLLEFDRPVHMIDTKGGPRVEADLLSHYALSPAGRTLLLGFDQKIRLYSLDGPRPLDVESRIDPTFAAFMNEEELVLASARGVEVVSVEDGKIARIFLLGPDLPRRDWRGWGLYSVSPDGRTLAVLTAKGVVRLIDLATGRAVDSKLE